jgi:hypothetical protein
MDVLKIGVIDGRLVMRQPESDCETLPVKAAHQNSCARYVFETQIISEVAAGVVQSRIENMVTTGSPPPSNAESWKRLLAGRAGVHVDFHANRHFDNFWSLPSHFNSPSRAGRWNFRTETRIRLPLK